MTLSELITNYRTDHGLSQRQMAARCLLSTGYISLIEKEINPQTGKRMVPTLVVLAKLAAGMGMTIDDLLAACDDMPVDISLPISSEPLSSTEFSLLSGFRELNTEGQTKALSYVEDLLRAGIYKNNPDSKTNAKQA